MLNHHQRVLACQGPEKLGGILGLRVRHPGGGFIQQQQMRILDQQHTDLEELFLPVRQKPGAAVAFTGQPQQDQHLINTIALFAVEFGPQACPDGLVGFHGDLKVFPYRQRFKDRRLLKLAPDPLAGNGGRFKQGQIYRLVINGFTAFWPRFAGDHVHQRGFPRAVGANYAAQLAHAYVQREIRQRLKSIEVDVDLIQLQHRVRLLAIAIPGQLASK